MNEIDARKRQAATLRNLATRLTETIQLLEGRTIPVDLEPNTSDRCYARRGWQLLRTATAMIEHGDRARHIIAGWTDGPGSSGGQRVTGPTTDPTANGVDRTDPAAALLEKLDRHTATLDATARLVESGIANVLYQHPSDLGPAGSGACLACGHLCTGTANDRLRSGFCDGCRMAWTRDGKPDRTAWARARTPA